jgi:small subunit ribosomal protein S17
MAKSLTGIVSSKKTDKTIVVTEHVRLTHPLYRKQYTVTKKFMAHDEKNEAKEGDKVVIGETRPISARKHHTLLRVVEKAGVKHVEATPEVLKQEEPAAEKAPKAKKETKAEAKEQEA